MRLCGYVDMWLCEYVGLWQCGYQYVGGRLSGYSELCASPRVLDACLCPSPHLVHLHAALLQETPLCCVLLLVIKAVKTTNA